MTKPTPRYILFDWGDTVMCDFPEYSGPMVNWPRVQVVGGIEATLAGLQATHPLVLATNAAESGEVLVREALQRADLDGFFSHIFTARELGNMKPDPSFFEAILERLGCQPQQAVMVGDSYAADILGAKKAGLRAVWYNPHKLEVDSGHPQYDAEIFTIEELPAALEGLTLPDDSECMAWLLEQQASPNLIAHSRAVAAAAYRLAVWLRHQGEPIDPLLTHRGGLLHDLDKITSRHEGEQHGQMSARLLQTRGQTELAELARRHLVFNLSDLGARPETWEQKLVFFADKLVEMDQVVGLEQRLNALHSRYPQFSERFRLCRPMLIELETEICSRIKITKEALYQRLRQQAL